MCYTVSCDTCVILVAIPPAYLVFFGKECEHMWVMAVLSILMETCSLYDIVLHSPLGHDYM